MFPAGDARDSGGSAGDCLQRLARVHSQSPLCVSLLLCKMQLNLNNKFIKKKEKSVQQTRVVMTHIQTWSRWRVE